MENSWFSTDIDLNSLLSPSQVRATSHDQIIRAISRSFSDILINAKDPEFRKKCLDIIEVIIVEIISLSCCNFKDLKVTTNSKILFLPFNYSI